LRIDDINCAPSEVAWRRFEPPRLLRRLLRLRMEPR
jgi:hypothetical protein